MDWYSTRAPGAQRWMSIAPLTPAFAVTSRERVLDASENRMEQRVLLLTCSSRPNLVEKQTTVSDGRVRLVTNLATLIGAT